MLLRRGLNILLPMLIIMPLGKFVCCFVLCVDCSRDCVYFVHMMCTLLFNVEGLVHVHVHLTCCFDFMPRYTLTT